MSVRSASRGSAAARSIRLALRASSIVATSSDSLPRCVLRCSGRSCSSSALIPSARRSIPVMARVLAPPKAASLNHTPIYRVNNPSHQTDRWQAHAHYDQLQVMESQPVELSTSFCPCAYGPRTRVGRNPLYLLDL